MVGKLKYIPPEELFVLHSNIRLPSISTKSMFVCLLPIVGGSLVRTPNFIHRLGA